MNKQSLAEYKIYQQIKLERRKINDQTKQGWKKTNKARQDIKQIKHGSN